MVAQHKVSLTDKGIKALKAAPVGKRIIVWDGVQPHLAVRVTDRADEKGRALVKTFLVIKRRPGDKQPVQHVLGTYPAMSLSDAREAAELALKLLAKGKRPKDVEEERRREEDRKRKDSVAALSADFIKRHCSKLRGARAMEAMIRRELLGEKLEGEAWVRDPELPARWRDRPVTEIRHRDVIELVEDIAEHAPYQARKVLAGVRKMFSWALHRDSYGLDLNPCSRVKVADLLGAPKARDRVLGDSELQLVWNAAEAEGYPFGTLTQTLMLTGQRLREIADARWGEIEGDVLTVPPERMKNKRAHSVPLTPRALELLTSIKRVDDDAPGAKKVAKKDAYIFTTTFGASPISGFSKAKAHIDKRIAELVAKERAQGAEVDDVEPWSFHDLRRTCRTRLSELGVLPLVSELVIGHAQSGIAAVYDLHRYDSEKRAALLKWEQRLLGIVEEPKPAPESGPATAPNVVKLAAVRRGKR